MLRVSNGIKALLLSVLLVLAGCAGQTIDRSYQAQSVDSRIQYLVLHYTAADLQRSIELLTGPYVSSHYLIDGNKVYQLADESLRAAHAGNSQWQGRTWLNASSIGIEMVHPGYLGPEHQPQWIEWDTASIERLIPLLHELRQRYQIGPNAIVGHADIAPQRKLDPGPLFPWHRLAKEGLIPWPLSKDLEQQLPLYQQELPNMAWFQQQLAELGYAIEQTGQADEQSRNVLAVFQMKYRPAQHDGQADAETAAMLWSLNRQLQQGR